jgi:hypothetical protein
MVPKATRYATSGEAPGALGKKSGPGLNPFSFLGLDREYHDVESVRV